MFLKDDMMFNKKHSKFSKEDKNLATADHMKDVYDLLSDYKKHSDKSIDIKVLLSNSAWGVFFAE